MPPKKTSILLSPKRAANHVGLAFLVVRIERDLLIAEQTGQYAWIRDAKLI